MDFDILFDIRNLDLEIYPVPRKDFFQNSFLEKISSFILNSFTKIGAVGRRAFHSAVKVS